MKSKATGCGSISTVFSSIDLLCVSSLIIIIIKIAKEIMKFVGNKNIKTNIFKTQGYDSIM